MRSLSVSEQFSEHTRAQEQQTHRSEQAERRTFGLRSRVKAYRHKRNGITFLDSAPLLAFFPFELVSLQNWIPANKMFRVHCSGLLQL